MPGLPLILRTQNPPMPNANLKNAIFILLFATALAFAGCTSPEEERAETLAEAAELAETGNFPAALEVLEQLSESYPDDPEILARIGQIHRRTGDPTMAAFYLEQAFRQTPSDTALLYETYTAQAEAGQQEAAGALLEELANTAPERLKREQWLELGRYHAANNRLESALDAYLKGVDTVGETVEPQTAADVGRLFLQVGNRAQAERWLSRAAATDSPAALEALFGLLEIQLTQENWAEAEATVARLDESFPGALDASEWADARAELQRWRAAQEKMRAELARNDPDSAGEAEAVDDDEPTTDSESSDAPEADAPVDTAVAAAGDSAPETQGNQDDADNGKAGAVADLAAAEAMADRPAIAPETNPGTAGEEDATATFDPSIPIEPVDPALSFEVTFDEQGTGAPVAYAVRNTPQNGEATDFQAAPELFGERPPAPARPAQQPRTPAELVEEAEALMLDRNYEEAIRHFWQALGSANDRADIWSRLSEAYLVDGQTGNAETTALEATRLAPDTLEYTLDYLRIAQRTKRPADFVAELETAYDRFPRSPELTLSLARAYERIQGNREAAASLYERFLDAAPNHPLSSDARSALARLR